MGVPINLYIKLVLGSVNSPMETYFIDALHIKFCFLPFHIRIELFPAAEETF